MPISWPFLPISKINKSASVSEFTGYITPSKKLINFMVRIQLAHAAAYIPKQQVMCSSAPPPPLLPNRTEAKEILQTTLHKIKVPDKLLLAFMHGIDSWETLWSREHITPLYRGSVMAEDVTLVQAFQDQNAIGWDQLLRGRIVNKWRDAYIILSGEVAPGNLHVIACAIQVVIALWTFAVSLWKFRNGEVYGHTAEEEKVKEHTHLIHTPYDALE
jgi:hypothetical protein